MKEDIIIFGASDHTKYTIDIIEQEGQWNIAGILDHEKKAGDKFAGYEILGKDADLPEVAREHDIDKGIVAIGDNYIRYKVARKVREMNPDFTFVKAIHPSARIGKNVTIGEGTVIMAGVIINNDCVVGESCFLATNSSLDHDSSVGNFSSFSPGVTTGGNVVIGSCTAVGLGANILHGKSIGNHTMVGAGALVVKDVDNNVVTYGVPARVIRNRLNGEKYL